jgi:hypothetical protein
MVLGWKKEVAGVKVEDAWVDGIRPSPFQGGGIGRLLGRGIKAIRRFEVKKGLDSGWRVLLGVQDA